VGESAKDHRNELASDERFQVALHRIGVVVDLLRLSGARDIKNIEPLLHPDMQVVPAPGIAPKASRRGRAGFLDYFRDTESKGILMEPDAYEIQHCLSGKVLVAGSLRFTNNGTITQAPVFYVYAFRDGLISCLETHLDREGAKQSASLLHDMTR